MRVDRKSPFERQTDAIDAQRPSASDLPWITARMQAGFVLISINCEAQGYVTLHSIITLERD